MKKILTVLLSVCLWAVMGVPAALAANRVPEMEIDVALRSDGSAAITQVWTTDTDAGTEFYLDCSDSGYLTITDFSVSDQNGPYTSVEDWDISASFAEKAYKCGIVETDDGVELCWGVSAYGENRYTIQYVLHDLVGAYSDADGFNYRFVDEMSFFPTDVALTIRNQDGTPLTDEACDIWAFGFDGQIQFQDGTIRAWSESPLQSGQNMTVMVSLKKGILSPLRTVADSFETVKDLAFADSDYDTDEPITAVDIAWMVGSLAAIVGAVVGIVTLAKARKRARQKKLLDSVDYFRDVPNGGNLNVSYALGEDLQLCTPETYLAARMLRLITLGSLEPETAGNEVAMRFLREPHNGDSCDEALYTFLEAAAGADGVLQAKELERFCGDDRHARALNNLLENCGRDGRLTLKRSGCFRSGTCRRVKDLTEKGRREWQELLGLKRYLLDFSLLSERGVAETFLWQEYMVYAALLGIAKQVTAQLRDLYPDQLMQVEQYQRYLYSTAYWNHALYGAVERQRAAQQAARSSGSGGRASSGGGGGFSGGGGGGVR